MRRLMAIDYPNLEVRSMCVIRIVLDLGRKMEHARH